jgi:hypothetical protein
MSLPFTTDQFLGVFADYNRAVWPAQVLLYALALVLAVFGYLGHPKASRLIALGLSLLWAWMGGVYHLWFFRRINPAAIAFGTVFLLQALLFAAWGLTLRSPAAGRLTGARTWVGGALLGYALAVYPLLAWLLGHRYPSSPTFGLPCPTTVATLGLLVWVSSPPPWWLLVVPLLWVLVGSSAAWALGMREDFGLLGAGVAAGAWLWYQSRHKLAIAPTP